MTRRWTAGRQAGVGGGNDDGRGEGGGCEEGMLTKERDARGREGRGASGRKCRGREEGDANGDGGSAW